MTADNPTPKQPKVTVENTDEVIKNIKARKSDATGDDWLDELCTEWEFEVTGTPKHWDKTDERQAVDKKYKAAIQARIAAAVTEADIAARVDELYRLSAINADIAEWPMVTKRLKRLLARQAADKGLREDTCQLCGLPNPVWFAPNELWNKVMRDPDEGDKYQFICPRCFAFEAEAVGITPTAWVLQVEGTRG